MAVLPHEEKDFAVLGFIAKFHFRAGSIEKKVVLVWNSGLHSQFVGPSRL
jgi:hypothetical protein